MDLITLQEYKDFNGLVKPDDDVRNTALIGMVSALIQTYVGLDDVQGGITITETLSVDYDTDTLFLSHYPVASMISLTESDRYTYDSTIHVPLVYASDYRLNTREGILTRSYRVGGFANWPLSPGSVEVTYITSPKWASGVIPADLKLATIELANYYKNEEWKSKTIQGSTATVSPLSKSGEFPQHVQVILDKYKDANR